jgi:hypothetical protein
MTWDRWYRALVVLFVVAAGAWVITHLYATVLTNSFDPNSSPSTSELDRLQLAQDVSQFAYPLGQFALGGLIALAVLDIHRHVHKPTTNPDEDPEDREEPEDRGDPEDRGEPRSTDDLHSAFMRPGGPQPGG